MTKGLLCAACLSAAMLLLECTELVIQALLAAHLSETATIMQPN